MAINLDLSNHEYWMGIAITGLISTPLIPIGLGPDMYLLSERHFIDAQRDEFSKALKESFADFGLEASESLTLNNPKLILVPLADTSDESVQEALKVADFALATFNRKYFPSKAKFIKWDRYTGKAIGVLNTKGIIAPIKNSTSSFGPAIVSDIGQDFWDWFLSSYIRGQLPELGNALAKCLEWERESQNSPHITHRFAFNWVGLESMLPEGEIIEGDMIRRFCLIMGAPRNADSRTLMGRPDGQELINKYKNPHAKLWVKAVEEMYRYRCSIFHHGSSDMNSSEVEPNKVDWFYHLTKTLNHRVTGLAINALVAQVKMLDEFWDSYVLDYLYSETNHWFKNGTFHGSNFITYDWKAGRYPEVF